MQINVVIADDNRDNLEYLKKMLLRDPTINILAKCKDGHETLTQINNRNPDAVFIDIEMPGICGINVKKEIPHVNTVFVSGHGQYAAKAYELGVIDFIVKPYNPQRVALALQRVKSIIATNNALNTKQLCVYYNREYFFINIDEILFIEKEPSQKTIIHTNSQIFETYDTLNKISVKLAPYKQFVRCHRSYIVNFNNISRITPWANNTQLINFTGTDKTALISRSKNALIEELVNYL